MRGHSKASMFRSFREQRVKTGMSKGEAQRYNLAPLISVCPRIVCSRKLDGRRPADSKVQAGLNEGAGLMAQEGCPCQRHSRAAFL